MFCRKNRTRFENCRVEFYSEYNHFPTLVTTAKSLLLLFSVLLSVLKCCSAKSVISYLRKVFQICSFHRSINHFIFSDYGQKRWFEFSHRSNKYDFLYLYGSNKIFKFLHRNFSRFVHLFYQRNKIHYLSARISAIFMS